MGVVRYIPALFRPAPPTFQRFDQINLCPVVFEIHPNDCGILAPAVPKIKTRKINNFYTAYFVLSAKVTLRKLYKIRNGQNRTTIKLSPLQTNIYGKTENYWFFFVKKIIAYI